MAGNDLVELKFRLFDGTDIGPNKYDPSTTIGSLKEIILDRWPEDYCPSRICGKPLLLSLMPLHGMNTISWRVDDLSPKQTQKSCDLSPKQMEGHR